MAVPDLKWPRVLFVALLVLLLFFGINHLYQRYFKNEALVEALCSLEGIAAAEIISEKGTEIAVITPDNSYQGELESLFDAVEKEISGYYRIQPAIEIKDRRSALLHRFASAVSPDLYGAARTGCYREAAHEVGQVAAACGLTDYLFTVDSRHIYLQARDGSSYLYIIVPLPSDQEGGAAHA